MHKVFIDDKELIFENVYSNINFSDENFLVLSNSEFALNDVLLKLKEGNISGIIYLCNNIDQAWNEFAGRYILMEAAGGVVRNNLNEILVIYRKKKWDLPKGKLDYEETPEEAAIREVKEECGIKSITIDQFLLKTFHTYTEKNKFILKKTHWYKMTSTDIGELIPQAEEEIEEARWMNKEKIIKKAFSKTYTSIKEVLTKYFDEEKSVN